MRAIVLRMPKAVTTPSRQLRKLKARDDEVLGPGRQGGYERKRPLDRVIAMAGESRSGEGGDLSRPGFETMRLAVVREERRQAQAQPQWSLKQIVPHDM